MKIQLTDRIKADESFVLLIPNTETLARTPLSEAEQEFVKLHYQEKKRNTFFFNRLVQYVYVHVCGSDVSHGEIEKLRRKGDEIATHFSKEKVEKAVVMPVEADNKQTLALVEGMALGSYRFERHKKKDEDQKYFNNIKIASGGLEAKEVESLENLVKACYMTRDLVNEPGNIVNAQSFATHMQKQCTKAGAVVKVLGKEEIKKAGMEALLTVNKGSKTDPTFTIMEWKPQNAINQKPIVLVGKGLVFDTGGINLKPTAGLETMKCDMAGGAAVFGALFALAFNKVPVYVIGLVPATDNRPGEQAMLPGDIIRMSNGKTIEIINTDAEGRLILADALIYAQQFDPELVIDLATLTGAAQMAFGKHGMAGMHQDAAEAMEMLKESGWNVYERIAELPFWEEYGDEMVSDIADLRNLGKGKGGGAITAGKFLANFISYPWIHLDIAGVAFMEGRDSYRGNGATASGVRLLYDFLTQYTLKHKV